MIRSRNLDKWGKVFSYSSPEAFVSDIVQPGVHEISDRGHPLDLLVEDNGADTTLVVFHAALSAKIETVPAFSGLKVSKRSGVNLVAAADPSMGLGDIDLAWFLGGRDLGPLGPVFSPVIHHAVDSLGSKRVVLMGASGGGFAAVHFGQYFPDSTVLAINPRLRLSGGPTTNYGKYLALCHGGELDPAFTSTDLADHYMSGLNFDLLLYQNTGDDRFRTQQSGPFVQKLIDEPRLLVREQFDGDGHKPIKPETLVEILSLLGQGVSSPGFGAAKESSLATLRLP